MSPGAREAAAARYHAITTRELIQLFLRLGCTSIGGPAAHIALMKDEVVTRRHWLGEAEFLDLLGATNLIPGPGSTQLAIHLGYRRAGWPGLVAAGLCFLSPAVLIVMACGWAYRKYGALPQAQAVLYGVKPVIIAIVVCSVWSLIRSALRDWYRAALGAAALVLSVLGTDVLVLLFGAGALSATFDWVRTVDRASPRGRQSPRGLLYVYAIAAGMMTLPNALTRTNPSGGGVARPYSIAALFGFFLKVGLTIYGGGYVLIAFLREGLVHQWRWLTEAQLLDAIAVGQFTPGPLFTSATFVGYLKGGTAGALAATLAIFLPSFILVAISGPVVRSLRQSRMAGAFLDGVNVAAVALMATVTGQLAQAALVDFYTVAIAGIAGALFLRYRINSVWLICAGALCGLIIGMRH